MVGTSVLHQPDVVVVQVRSITVPVGVVLHDEGRGHVLVAEAAAGAPRRRRVRLHHEGDTVGAGVVVPQVHLRRDAEVVGEVDAGLVPDGAELAVRRWCQANSAGIVLPNSAKHEVGSRVGGVAVRCSLDRRSWNKRYKPDKCGQERKPSTAQK